MSSPDSDFIVFLHEFLTQPLLSRARQTFNDNHFRITEELLQELEGAAKEASDHGNLSAAASIYQVAANAALVTDKIAYLFHFLEKAGVELHHAGEREQAARMLLEGCEAASQLVKKGVYEALHGFVAVSLRFAALEEEQNNFDSARQILSRLRWQCRAAGALSGELWAALGLANICLQQNDLPTAKAYIELVLQLCNDLRDGESYVPDPPDKEEIYSILFEIAKAFYYRRDDYQNTAILAEQAIEFLPEQVPGYYLLGNSQMRLEQYKEAIPTWERAIAIDPNVYSFYLSYAVVLRASGCFQEAIKALGQGIRLKPEDPRFYFNRGEVHQILEQDHDAIADFTRVISLVEQAPESPSKTTPQFRSQDEYIREIPSHDLADFARIQIIHSYKSLGEYEKVETAIGELIKNGDEPTQAAGYRLRGNIYAELGRYSEAVAAYSSAIELLPGMTTARLYRADAYLAQEKFDEAIIDLAHAANRTVDPGEAIVRLEKILEKQPRHPLARKWLGYAYFELMQSVQAVEALSTAIELLPADSDLFMWRGLARITMSAREEDKEWNEHLDLGRIFGAVEDLAFALHLQPDNAEALDAYKWLVDRVTADWSILNYLSAAGDLEKGIYRIVPDWRTPIQSFLLGIDLGGEKRQWKQALKELEAARVGLLKTGLPVFATRVHVHLADNYLRLYELQAALDHLSEAEKFYQINFRPLTNTLLESAEMIAQRALIGSGKPVASIEVDYLPVYSISFPAYDRLIRGLKADAHARIGDYEQAISALGDVDEYFGAVKEVTSEGTFQSLLAVVIIFRNAGQYDRALELSSRLEKTTKSDANLGSLYNTRSLIYEASGDYETSSKWLQRAYELVSAADPARAYLVRLSMAQNYTHRGHHEEALSISDQIDPEWELTSPLERFNYYGLRVKIFSGLGRNREAQQAVFQALSNAEEIRGQLRTFDTRMSWQATRDGFYRLAVQVALANRDYVVAFELIEKSKARAFVDQLASGHLPLPPSTKRIQEIYNNLQINRSLLAQLLGAIELHGPEFVDYEIVRKLEGFDLTDIWKQPGNGSDILSEEKIREHLDNVDATLLNLAKQIEDERLSSAGVTFGAPVSLNELKELLKC